MLRDLVEEHASEAGLLWALRDLGVREPHYDLADLTALDGRIEAHVDALRLAGDGAFEVVKEALFAELEDEHAGEVFTAAVIAVERGDLEMIAALLDRAGASPALTRGLISALGWAPFEAVERILPGLLDDDPGHPNELRALGLAAMTAHGRDPGRALARAFESDDARLRARALGAAGALGRVEHFAAAYALADDRSEACRFAAGYCLCLTGKKALGVPPLRALALQGGKHAEEATVLVARCAEPRAARALVEAMLGHPGSARRALAGAGALGDSALVPRMLDAMDDPSLARAAGEAFTMVTGVDLRTRPFTGRAPEGFDAGPSDDPESPDVALDPDRNLPWPDPAALRRFWAEQGGRFPAGARLLLGRPIDAAHLAEVLRGGLQRQRAAATLEQAIAEPSRPLFNVRAPGFRQRRLLHGGQR